MGGKTHKAIYCSSKIPSRFFSTPSTVYRNSALLKKYLKSAPFFLGGEMQVKADTKTMKVNIFLKQALD